MPFLRCRFISVLALYLSYLLVILLCVPFTTAARLRLFVTPVVHLDSQKIPHRDGEVLVRFRGGISQRDKDTILTTHGVKKINQLRGASGFEKLELFGSRDSKTVALELLMNPQVEFAEPNYLIAKDDLTPNDPQFNEQWHCATAVKVAGSTEQISMRAARGQRRPDLPPR